jgi:uncharacterized membrane protein
MKFIVIIIFTIISFCKSIYFVIKPNGVECFETPVHENTEFVGKYLFAGEVENRNKVEVLDDKDNVIWSEDNKIGSVFKINEIKSTFHKICFHNKDKKMITVTIELYDEGAPLKLVSAKNVNDMNNNIHEMRKKVDIIHHDLRNFAVRRNAHIDISNLMISKIKSFTFLKIAFLIFFSIIQVFVITNIFKSKKVVNKIIIDENYREENEKL